MIDLKPLIFSYGKHRSYYIYKIKKEINEQLKTNKKIVVIDSSGTRSKKELYFILIAIGIEQGIARNLIYGEDSLLL